MKLKLNSVLLIAIFFMLVLLFLSIHTSKLKENKKQDNSLIIKQEGFYEQIKEYEFIRIQETKGECITPEIPRICKCCGEK